jgi:hypothetical protein
MSNVCKQDKIYRFVYSDPESQRSETSDGSEMVTAKNLFASYHLTKFVRKCQTLSINEKNTGN